jgi:riboflavin kinase/FMN adenylyltransferase
VRILFHIEDFQKQSATRPVLSFGNFDGVHRGHQYLLAQVVEEAKKRSTEAVAVTFSPHPQFIVQGKEPSAIFTLAEKLQKIQAQGVDECIIHPFDIQTSRLDPQDFVHLVMRSIQPQLVILGYDFRFGKGGGGDFFLFEEIASEYQCEVRQSKPFSENDQPVSSSRIRKLLEHHDLQQANTLLGSRYAVQGKVIKGKKLGRELGFPTANLDCSKMPLLPEGIYGAWVNGAGFSEPRLAAVSYSTNPTVNTEETHPVLEVYILDFSGDLYGQLLEVEFDHWIRDSIRFADLDELKKQMQSDVALVRQRAQG